MTSNSRKALRVYFDLKAPTVESWRFPDEIADKFDDFVDESRKLAVEILLQEFPIGRKCPEKEMEFILGSVYGYLQGENELTFPNFARQFEQYYQKMQKHWEEHNGILV